MTTLSAPDILQQVPPDVTVFEGVKKLGAVVLISGQTEFADPYRKAGIPLGGDETYIDLHMNVAGIKGNSLDAVCRSLGWATQYITEQGLTDGAVIFLTYPRLGVAASRLGFRTAHPNWRTDFPYGLIDKVASWDPANAKVQKTQRYIKQGPVVASYLRTADFVGLFGDE